MRRSLRNSLADNWLTSLSQSVGDYLDAEKQQDDQKPAPTEIRDDGLGPLFSHWCYPLFQIPFSF